jgi:hypothetical protein
MKAGSRVAWLSAVELPRIPTTGIAGCCARAASGHVAAPRRRFMQFPDPCLGRKCPPQWNNRQSITPGHAGLWPISRSQGARNQGPLHGCCGVHSGAGLGQVRLCRPRPPTVRFALHCRRSAALRRTDKEGQFQICPLPRIWASDVYCINCQRGLPKPPGRALLLSLPANQWRALWIGVSNPL